MSTDANVARVTSVSFFVTVHGQILCLVVVGNVGVENAVSVLSLPVRLGRRNECRAIA